ncbi:MAG: choice-of-anchor D domain-containing protein [Candidatus Glassbacteria bacterium]|nr:choice-of-anchor D domain-containing protein [Candidatus Glassbacteria bacterium]
MSARDLNHTAAVGLLCLSLLAAACDREPPTSAGVTGLSISGQILIGGQPGPNVDLRLFGDFEATATTDSLGNYQFTDLVTGIYAVRPVRSGFDFSPDDLELELERSSVIGQDFTMIPETPWLLIDKEEVDFGAVEIGDSRTLMIGLSNLGKKQLTVTSLISSNPVFKIANSPVVVPRDSLVYVEIIFSPTAAPLVSATITISSDDPASPQKTVSVTGRGLAGGSAQIVVTPGQLGFPAVRVGSSVSLKLTITNPGTDILHIDSVLSSHLAFRVNLPANALAFGRSLELGVTFVPTDTGSISGQLRISTDAVNSPKVSVLLSGTAISSLPSSIVLEPEAVDFGEVFRDSLSSLPLKVSNTGDDSLVITALRINTGASFSTAFSGGTVIAPGESREFTVRFSSSSLGQFRGSMTIFHSDEEREDIIVPLSASVVDVPPEFIRLSPDTVRFDSIGVGAESIQQLWIVNPNSVPLSVWAFQLPDSTFSVAVDSIPVPPGDSIPLVIRFSPQAEGSFSGRLTMQTNVVGSPSLTVPVAGKSYQSVTGDISLTDTRIDFGTQALGSVAVANVTVSNDGGNRLAIRSVGTTNSIFVVTSSPDTIPANQGGTITLEFRPTTVGLFAADLLISSSAPDNPTVKVTLLGGGVDTSATGTALLTLSTRLVDVGQVVQGLTGTSLLNIGNIGKDTLRVSGFSLSHEEFSVSPPQLQVPPGSELAVTVGFAPTVSGEVSGTLVLFSNDQLRSTDTIQVKGVGVTEGGVIEDREKFIQGGSFLMGFAGEEGPVRQVTMSSFYMDAFEVTNELYQDFVDQGGYNTQAYWSDEGWNWRLTGTDYGFDSQNPRPRYWADSGAVPWEADQYSSRPNSPVVGVSWYEAEAYARFRAKALPTEAQWEYAARGSQGRIYPWGDIWFGDRANHGQLRSPYYDESDGDRYTSSISAFPQGQTPTGLFGMAGNVMEWIADWFGPYDTAGTNNPTGPSAGLERVLRGGSWQGSNDLARGFHRNKSLPRLRYPDGGIRLVRNF